MILISRRVVRGTSHVVVAGATVLVAAGCGSAPESGLGDPSAPTVVVTTPVLGAVVREVVGDGATVDVLMPEGLDPHDWEPSAKDIEAVHDADLVVVNGLGLEESLDDALGEAEADGVPVFSAGDHIEVRRIHADEDNNNNDNEDAIDPHLWTDPLAMRDVVEALAPVLAEAGIATGSQAATVADELVAVDHDADSALSVIPAGGRRLVTAHESLGYFADRYGFDLVGSVVPSTSSLAETSAGELAALSDRIEEENVDVIFTELGASADVVDAVAAETGARVVELATHTLPDDGSYRTFVLDLATTIAAALTAPDA